MKTRRQGGITRFSANWGDPHTNDLQLIVDTGISEAGYKLVHPSGSPVHLGRVGYESSGSGGTVISTWLNGVTVEVVFFVNPLRAGSTTDRGQGHYGASTLAFAKAALADLM